MELRHLRYFVAVAGEESVTHAAARLHVSQPGLSRQIHDLEEELGFALLTRDSKGVRLTEAGRVFWIEAQAILARVEEAVASARSVASGKRGQFHVGYAPSLAFQILPPALRSLQAALPGVQVMIHDLSTEEMLAGLQARELDIAITAQPSKARLRGLHFEPIARYRLALAVPPNHPFARLRAVKLVRLAKEPVLAYDYAAYPEYLDDLKRFFSSGGPKPSIVEEHDSVSSLITAIAAGRGVALVPETIVYMSGTRLCLVPTQPAPAPVVVGTVCRAGKPSAIVTEFIAGAKASVRGNG